MQSQKMGYKVDLRVQGIHSDTMCNPLAHAVYKKYRCSFMRPECFILTTQYHGLQHVASPPSMS